ncbi:MAG: hypothetical protein JWO66_8, partial [Candidatus Eremiobacteraeota bacterium]|nr:hypothetical protein [Candidatus Eremiobacteraeota bacterium]
AVAVSGPITAIGMQRTTCKAGNCPSFSVWFHSDGHAIYVGGPTAPRKGYYTATVDFAPLLARVESTHPQELSSWHYGPSDRDATRAIVILEHRSGRQVVEATQESDAPAPLKEMIGAIQNAADRAPWSMPAAAPAKKKS